MVEPVEITSPDDPRLAAFVHLRDRDLRQTSNLIVVEGLRVVERLIDSSWPCRAVACVPRQWPKLRDRVTGGTAVYLVAEDVLADAVGFHLHQGVIAVGLARPFTTPQALAKQLAAKRRVLLCVCPELTNKDNVGLMVRLAAGLGADALVLGPRCHDPLYRRAIRLSMGAVFDLPIVRSADVARDLAWLRSVLDLNIVAADASPGHTPLRDARVADRTALILGNESTGVPPDLLALANQRVGIDMHHGTDSLNVATAAAILLHWFGGSGGLSLGEDDQ